MQYNPPFDQPNNPNAPYVDGNPGNSIPGSIPPAAQMEYPQRELVAVIAESGQQPSNADLRQALRAIRGGQLTTFVDQSSAANAIVITPGTAHTSLLKGLPFRIWPAFTSTSTGVTVKVNTLQANLLRRDGTALAAGDVQAGVPIDVVGDGTNIRLVNYAPSDIAALIASTSPASGYVQIGDQSYPATAADRVIATTAAFSVPRTLTLPTASSRNPGDMLVFMDRAGAASATNTLTFLCSGADLVDGTSSFAVGAPFQVITFRSDGAGKWTYDRKASVTYRPAGDANVAILASDGTVETSTALTAARTWTLPPAASVRPGTLIVLDDIVGACSSATSVTLATAGADKINGAASLVLTTAYFQVLAVSDGASHWAVQYVDPAQVQNLINASTSGLEKGWRLAQYAVPNSAGLTITALDHQRIEVDVTNGPATINLPSPGANVQVDVIRRGTGTNAVTINGPFAFNGGSDTSLVLTSDIPQANSLGFYADGSVYRLSFGRTP